SFPRRKMYYYQLSSLRAATIYAFHIAPSVRRCEELARQAKPPAPPSLQTLGQKEGGADGFVYRAARKPIFTASQRGDGFSGESVPALTLGVIRPPVKMPLEIVSAYRNVGQLQPGLS